jgi:DNA-binding NtrC family response regulator
MALIMVIDDDADIRRVVQNALNGAGHQVVVAADGREGLKKYRAEPADLVITDMVMPHGEGAATIQALRREFPGLGIIAMSGASTHGATWLELAGRFGACYTLAKPFSMARLKLAVQDTLAVHPDPLGEAASAPGAWNEW